MITLEDLLFCSSPMNQLLLSSNSCGYSANVATRRSLTIARLTLRIWGSSASTTKRFQWTARTVRLLRSPISSHESEMPPAREFQTGDAHPNPLGRGLGWAFQTRTPSHRFQHASRQSGKSEKFYDIEYRSLSILPYTLQKWMNFWMTWIVEHSQKVSNSR